MLERARRFAFIVETHDRADWISIVIHLICAGVSQFGSGMVPEPELRMTNMKLPTFVAAAALSLTFAQPAHAQNIVETAQSAGTFKTLIAAATAAGLAGALSGDGPLTVFAPTDDAFAALPPGTVESLLKPENKDKLVAVLSYHVVGRSITSGMLPKGTIHVRTIKSGGDRTLRVTRSHKGVMVDGAKVIRADITADNGVIHVIDKVMLPSA